MTQNAAILGMGHALGSVVRGNDDPVFNYLHEHPQPNSDLFAGLKYRRVLGADETLSGMVAAAATAALTKAHVEPRTSTSAHRLCIGQRLLCAECAVGSASATRIASDVPRARCEHRVHATPRWDEARERSHRVRHDSNGVGRVRNQLDAAR